MTNFAQNITPAERVAIQAATEAFHSKNLKSVGAAIAGGIEVLEEALSILRDRLTTVMSDQTKRGAALHAAIQSVISPQQ